MGQMYWATADFGKKAAPRALLNHRDTAAILNRQLGRASASLFSIIKNEVSAWYFGLAFFVQVICNRFLTPVNFTAFSSVKSCRC